jgi:uncharacterized protein YndB with AHSA1/START domain
MQIILAIVLSVLGVFALLLVLALFVRKAYSVNRVIAIARPAEEVFEYVKYLKNQDNFSKWASMDENMKKSYKGTDGLVGFVSAWESKNKNVGKGEQEITRIVEGIRIEYEIRFIKPIAGIAHAYLTTEMVSNSETIVRWGFDSSMKYPMNLMLLFMNMDKMIGNDFEIGLNKLKKILEN